MWVGGLMLLKLCWYALIPFSRLRVSAWITQRCQEVPVCSGLVVPVVLLP